MGKSKKTSPQIDDKADPLARLERATSIIQASTATLEVLLKYPDCPGTIFLGPTLIEDDRWVDRLIPFAKKNDIPRFNRPNDMLLWKKNIPIKSWSNPFKEYLIWHTQLETTFSSLWKDIGIYDMLNFSRTEVPINKPLLSALSLFCSRSSNAFVFREGLMTISLLDFAVLFGLYPFSEEVSLRLKADISKFNISFKQEHVSYGPFISMNMKSTPVPDKAEHVAFLLYWLCRFVGCPSSIKIIKEFLPLAVALADGRKLALGPFFLSQFYRGMHHLVPDKDRNDFKSGHRPIRIIQLWFNAYFQDIMSRLMKPPHRSIGCYAPWVSSFKCKYTSFDEFFHFLYNPQGR